MSAHSESSTVTVVVSRRVKPGREAEYETLSTQMTEAAADFPGHLGAALFRPSAPDDPEYRTIFKFADAKSLDVWMKSRERASYTAEIEPLLQAPSEFETLDGLITWFSLPNGKGVAPPPRYKMAVVSWLALFPIVTLIFWLFEGILVQIPLVPRVLLVTLVVIVLMTWVVMPRYTKMFAKWLYPTRQDDGR